MTPKHWIGIVMMLVIMVPSIALVEGALRDSKEEEKDLIKLRFNKTFSLFHIIILVISSGLGLTFIVLPFIIKIYWLLILLPIGLTLLADLVFTINHLSVEMGRNIYWSKNENLLVIKKDSETIKVDSNNVTNIVRWTPRFKGAGRLAPGELLGKYQIFTKTGFIEISDLLLSDYPEIIENLTENISERKRQFNKVKTNFTEKE